MLAEEAGKYRIGKYRYVLKARLPYPTKIGLGDLTTKLAGLQYRTNSGKIYPRSARTGE